MCPAAHLLRFIVSGSVVPVSSAGIQSQCSTQEKAAARTLPSDRRTWRIFDQNHSEEYTPPSYFVKSVPPHPRAVLLMSSASFTAVWSFQSTNIAFGFSSNPFVNASGVPVVSTAQGVDPVVSIPMATTSLPAFLPILASAPFTDISMPSM